MQSKHRQKTREPSVFRFPERPRARAPVGQFQSIGDLAAAIAAKIANGTPRDATASAPKDGASPHVVVASRGHGSVPRARGAVAVMFETRQLAFPLFEACEAGDDRFEAIDPAMRAQAASRQPCGRNGKQHEQKSDQQNDRRHQAAGRKIGR